MNPSLDQLYDPFLLKDMGKAADRIIQAVECREQIVIYGDYDVDGVTSTSVLYDFLLSRGANVRFYIPDRMDEGYGLSIGAIEKIRQTGASLIITVDCGITAVEEVRCINRGNMQAIITDHHECRELLPEAYAVIDPCRADCTYPFKELAGVGVVFKLVHAICLKMGIDGLQYSYLDRVALGTVADVVPLTGENRIIVKAGLTKIEKSENPGIKALIHVSGLRDKPLTSYGIGFGLAPRINAAGRIGSAERAVKLFITSDPQQASAIAAELNDENKYRQDTEVDIMQQVISRIESQVDLDKEKVIVVAGEGWHHGIIGIVASKVTERYYKPCILISEENGLGKGSGRSIEGFNLFKALVHCGSLLEKFGGHELAAGLSLNIEKLADFRKMINAYADGVLTADDLVPRIKVDAVVRREDISISSVSELELLAPFGSGNPGPVFAYDGWRVNEIRAVGENKHLKLKLEDNGLCVDAIGFNMGELTDSYFTSDVLDSVFSLEVNSWNNSRKVQLNLKDIRLNEESAKERSFFYSLDKNIVFNGPNDYNKGNGVLDSLNSCKPEEIIPERADLAAVFQYIRTNSRTEPAAQSGGSLVVKDFFTLARFISTRYGVCMNYFKLKKCLEIFEELKLLKKEQLGDSSAVITVLSDGKNKANLEDSSLYRNLQGLKHEFAVRDGGLTSGLKDTRL